MTETTLESDANSGHLYAAYVLAGLATYFVYAFLSTQNLGFGGPPIYSAVVRTGVMALWAVLAGGLGKVRRMHRYWNIKNRLGILVVIWAAIALQAIWRPVIPQGVLAPGVTVQMPYFSDWIEFFGPFLSYLFISQLFADYYEDPDRILFTHIKYFFLQSVVDIPFVYAGVYGSISFHT